MNLIFLGPPGAGKGTQAKLICEQLNVPHISTGDILRNALKQESEIGIKAKKYVESGELVPDDIVIEIIKQRLQNEDARAGFILDGFPRTKIQAEHLNGALSGMHKHIDAVIYFQTSPRVSVERLSGRSVCSSCGANFHLKNMPPKKAGICDYCGSKLIQREDDKPQTVKRRLKVYTASTVELITYYETKMLLWRVDADKDASSLNRYLHKEVLSSLSRT